MTDSHTVRIWIAGDYQDAVRTVREFCFSEGACFAVQPVDYIYTGGMEAGVCVTRINYARFPADPDVIDDQCRRLAGILRIKLRQRSYSIEGPRATIWIQDTLPADGDDA